MGGRHGRDLEQNDVKTAHAIREHHATLSDEVLATTCTQSNDASVSMYSVDDDELGLRAPIAKTETTGRELGATRLYGAASTTARNRYVDVGGWVGSACSGSSAVAPRVAERAALSRRPL
jgi:hypothetical protein